MSESKSDESDGSAGCLLIVGSIIVGIALGNIFSSAIGWLVVGGCLIFIAAIDIAARVVRRKS